MMYPVIAGATIIAGMVVARGRSAPEVSPDVEAARRHIYVDAMMSKGLTSEYLRNLSATFRSQGLDAEADMLIKRAELTEASPELKAARKEALRKDNLVCRAIRDSLHGEPSRRARRTRRLRRPSCSR